MVGWGIALLLTWPLLVWAATPEAFEAVHYDLDVAYDAATHTLQGVVSCTAVWRGAHPLSELYFFLPPNTLSRPDPREPAAFRDLRYPRGFDAAKLDRYEALLECPDADLFDWISGRTAPPPEYDSDVTRLLLAFRFDLRTT